MVTPGNGVYFLLLFWPRRVVTEVFEIPKSDLIASLQVIS